MKSGKILLEIEPCDDDDIMVALYGDIVKGKTVKDLLDNVDVVDTFRITAWNDMKLTFRILKTRDKVGPVFIRSRPLFSPFFVFLDNDKGFESIDAAREITEWIFLSQMKWAEKYHGDWWDANGENYWTRTKRVH